MHTIMASIRNDQGVGFNVRLVDVGDSYGRDDCLVNDDGPMVEFFDTRFTEKFGPLGQFVSRYYVETFMEIEGTGLCLDAGIAAWEISAENVTDVQRWLRDMV
jgi:hypothetical protein